jgi:hypothetical protein
MQIPDRSTRHRAEALDRSPDKREFLARRTSALPVSVSNTYLAGEGRLRYM